VKIRDRLHQSTDFATWYDIVEMYSKTNLTKISKDHLIAISGIATEFREKLKDVSKPGIRFCRQYTSGLWYEDLHHGLLWQTRPSSTKVCMCGAPSWSWASRRGEIRWLPRSPTTKAAVQFKGIRDSWSQIHEEIDLRRWSALESFAKPSHTDLTSFDPFSTTSITAGIILEGQITPVVVRNLLWPTTDPLHKRLDKGTVKILARETEVVMVFPEEDEAWKNDPDCQYVAEWLLVCAPSTPKIIGGWALLDDVQYSKDLHSYEGAILPALHISTRRQAGKTDKSQDFSTRRRTVGRDVHEVMFLEPQEGNRYRRIGIGRIFDSQIITNMAESDQQEIELV